MNTAWEDRLTNVVFPAQLAGFHLYTGFGELQPGTGLPMGKGAGTNEAALKKPMGLPSWQVYLGAKPTQPAIRFLQLSHKIHNPAGSATLVYPTRLKNDPDRGVALIVALGEGLDTPLHELTIARDLQNQVLLRPVKVIALGRFRAFTTTSSWTLSEHLLMEVYSEDGDLIWVNPFIGMSLEEAVDKLMRKEPFQAKAALIGTGTTVALSKRQEVEADIRHLISQGLSANEIKDHLTQTRGLDLKVASRLFDGFMARKEPAQEVQAIVRQFAEQLEGYYEGDEFLAAVAEDSGQSLDTVRKVLSEATEEGRGIGRSVTH